MLLGCASTASASVTIGQVAEFPPTPSCTSDFDYLQPSVTGGNLYIAREAGTIVSWTTNSAAGATYVFKVFRRTTDPDAFQVISHAPPRTVTTTGLNTFPASISVRSGDMVGFHESGAGPTSCTFPTTGDSVLRRLGNLSDGSSGVFTVQNDQRLNLSAVLVPSNSFALGGVSRNSRRGTATITVTTSNPGVVTLSGRYLKTGRAAKTLAVPGSVAFSVAAVGKKRRILQRRGQVTVQVTISFAPIGGDPSSQSISLKLKQRSPPPLSS